MSSVYDSNLQLKPNQLTLVKHLISTFDFHSVMCDEKRKPTADAVWHSPARWDEHDTSVYSQFNDFILNILFGLFSPNTMTFFS